MRIVFMGTPDFAAASLKKLIEERFEVVGVFTQPDKPVGRKQELQAPPVKQLALAHDIPVFQPEKMRDGQALSILRELKPDLLAVVAYGKILPDELLAVPPFGAVNVHGSLLPKYRGASPIQWSVLNGDRVTGVSTMYLAHDMDAGDIIYQAETEIGEKESAGELYERLSVLGGELLVRTLRDIQAGTAPRRAQEEAGVSYVGKLDKSLSPIDWNRSPREVLKWIYGLLPWPVATMELQGQTLKVFAADYTGNHTDLPAGSLVSAGKAGIEMACAGGETLLITQVQAPGKKPMSAADYLRGHPLRG